ncbi:hypothetical protein [Sagittula salina]|uniref:Sulfotransferase family protein n=1 Tax=Sagittula salina TaxID=2820268 RepID=A0A940MQB5_9RHOB|nr:hypothetical protein [Sagittula salina]MBP0481124.1 hypothetical protein [Sagittula salina]
MEIILHLGAHRTATTSFQHYLHAHRGTLWERGLGFWGPHRTRDGLLQDVARNPESPHKARRAAGRLRLALEGARRSGTQKLVVTDETMLGSARRCWRAGEMYPGVGERIARLAVGFGHVRTISLQIRQQDLWWASVAALLIPRGEGLAEPGRLAAIAAHPRAWRDVITDVACACPGANIVVTPFERFADRPDQLLATMSGLTRPPSVRPGKFWRNRREAASTLREIIADRGEDPDCIPEGAGRYMPFDDRQRAALREAYADDLFWLETGADGLAILKSDTGTARRSLTGGAHGPKERGRRHDRPA